MEKSETKVGIAGWEVYLPEKFISAQELSKEINIPANVIQDKLGFNQKPVGGPDDHSVAMGIKASLKLIQKQGIDPKEIDLVLWAGEDYKEYICWTAAIAVQEAVGAINAWAFDTALRCAGTPLSLKLAKDLILTNPEIKTVLIAGGNTNAYLIDYRKPEQSFMFDMGPSGMAMIVKRDWNENEILGSHIITQSSMIMDVVGLKGGTRNPLTEEDVKNQAWKISVTDPEGMKKRLAETSVLSFTGAVRGALKKSGLKENDVDWLCPVHINPKGHKAILDDLGISEDKAAYLRNYGHCGHPDNLIGLKIGLEEGKVKDGSIVAFLGAGTGYAFSSVIIRWGK